MPSASIIVPVWNGEGTIPKCLKSVFRQDYEASEVIIIDDGSTDRTLEFVKNTAGGKPNVRILRHAENQGLGKTLNEGIKEARGEFVLIVHADCEIVENDFLKRAASALAEHTDVAAVTGRRVYQIGNLTDREKLYMVANGHLAEIASQESETQYVAFTEHKCDLFRKWMVESVGGFFDARFRRSGEDQVLSSELRNRGYRLMRLGSISYRLGFGTRESTIGGIFERILLYGRTQAGVLITQRRSSLNAISQSKALSKRAANRLQMVLSSSAILAGIALSLFSPFFIILSLSAITFRLTNYAIGLKRLGGRLRFALVGPVIDVVYSLGFLQGVVKTGLGRQL